MVNSFQVSHRNACFIVTLFVIIVVCVGLMAGLIGKDDCSGCSSSGNDLTSTLPPLTTTTPSWEDEPFRNPFLPDFLSPVHYDLWMHPDFYGEGNTFEGKETVEIAVTKETKYLMLHIKLMDITKTEVRGHDGQLLDLTRTFEYPDNQYWVVELANPIDPGTSVFLCLEFTGSLTEGIVGYYKSTYEHAETGRVGWMSTTKFQPSDARKAYPCFDEPRFKSTFNISQRHWRNYTALSNMPEYHHEDDENGWRETYYEKTVRMSSYLVAFIVFDFEHKDNIIEPAGIPHRMWAAPDRINQTSYGLEVTKAAAEALEKEFNMTFHLPKLDQVAVPDYPSGATEHWGLITYRESRLLYDPDQVGDYDKQRVATIIAHELVHNYFGNVITCYWWDEIWLNEGYARLYEAFAVDVFDPEFHLQTQFVVNTMQTVMATDAGGSSRPVVVVITNPDEANSAFDSITYSKGASMLRMIEGFVGVDRFRLANQRFLRENEFGSVKSQDLWDAIQKEVGDEMNVTAIMTPWVMQMGLPVINLVLEDNNVIRATQKRFMNDPDADLSEPESPYGYRWDVLLAYETKNGDSDRQWMHAAQESVEFSVAIGNNNWVKFNPNEFEPLDRSNILDDALNIARAGQLDYEVPLNITQYLVNEDEFAPWATVYNNLMYISNTLYWSSVYGPWRRYVEQLSRNRMSKLGVRDEGSHLEKLNRDDIMLISCLHGNEECLVNSSSLFTRWVQDESDSVPTNLRAAVYAFGMQEAGGDDEFDVLWHRYDIGTSGQEKNNILYALAQSTKMWHIQRLLDYSQDPEMIRDQDFFTLIGNIGANPLAKTLLWDWTRANYDALIARFGNDNRSFQWMVPGMVDGYTTQFELQQVEDFYEQYPDAGPGARSREESLDSIRNNIKWRERSEHVIAQWLEKNA
ncbi:hypothetical protein CAPTEDRAFT_205328 [Capitella teleta]|uniref:Aminopeptidase n=1 Tax=Capitella teleta TaxID=283909 RepID=R7TSC3_CAPTE|nr:hypothetical protein CAPTEDRAFT_205328 [Capitella teleta]|eukprot:ELT93925.1 hypothetical protein CAPTEDRAFT_205328 [Capitella teleta]